MKANRPASSFAVATPSKDVLASHGPYNASVPKPEAILGYSAGSRHSTYRDMERVVLGISSAAKDRVRVFEYGRSWEGRPLRVLAITSPKNIARLEEIRKSIGQLANPDGKSDPKATVLNTPPIIWINECIHGDETASFESGMWLLYNLAASENRSITSMLDDAVVILNPVFNPDGHERFVVWYNAASIGDPEGDSFEHNPPGFMRGRVNHYRFDMNRDHITLSQIETLAETTEYRRWNPQVYVDQHGQVESYFFPPNPMAINVNVDRDRLNKWTEILGKATAAAFDKQGWVYMVKNEFDFYAPNYTDTWATLNGGIGMTHETDHGASIREKRRDGTEATLKGAVEKHFTSALAVIQASASRRQELLSDFAKFKADAAAGKLAGKFQRVVVPASGQEAAVTQLAEILARHGIVAKRAGANTTLLAGHDFWSANVAERQVSPGDLVIDMAQPQGALAKALLEPHSDFEEAFVKEQQRRRKEAKDKSADPDAGSYEFYDITAWSLIFGCGVSAYWFESANPLETVTPTAEESGTTSFKRGASGYWIKNDGQAACLSAIALLKAGINVYVATRDLESADTKVPAGSFMILRDRNSDDLDDAVKKALASKAGTLLPLDTVYPGAGRYGVGSGRWQALKKPKIGIYFGSSSQPSDFGATWFVVEKEFGLPFTALSSQSLSGDLHDYTCIVFPGRAPALSQKLKDWIQAGGCAVVLGDFGWLNGQNDLPKAEPTKTGDDAPPYLPGSLFLGSLDRQSFLSYGLPNGDDSGVKIAVPVDGASYTKVVDKASSVLTLPAKAEDVKLLSGWTWPEETSKALAGSTWAQVHDMGQGRVVLFGWNPCERAMYPGQWQLLLNAMVFGPR